MYNKIFNSSPTILNIVKSFSKSIKFPRKMAIICSHNLLTFLIHEHLHTHTSTQIPIILPQNVQFKLCIFQTIISSDSVIYNILCQFSHGLLQLAARSHQHTFIYSNESEHLRRNILYLFRQQRTKQSSNVFTSNRGETETAAT